MDDSSEGTRMATKNIVEMSAKMRFVPQTHNKSWHTHDAHHSVFANFHQLSTACIRPEEDILRGIWIVVNRTGIDKWVVGNHRVWIANYTTICSTLIHISPKGDSFTMVLKIIVIIGPSGLDIFRRRQEKGLSDERQKNTRRMGERPTNSHLLCNMIWQQRPEKK
jgi:hypothetical protein